MISNNNEHTEMPTHANVVVNSNETERKSSYNPALIVATQLITVVLLVTAALINTSTHKVIIVLCAIMIALLVIFWPFKSSIIDRAISAASGCVSLWCVTLSLKGLLPSSVIDNETVCMHKFVAAMRPYERWAVSFALILVVATFVSFFRQMLREKRTNLVRNLSHTLTACVSCAAAAGWMFLPSIIKFTASLRNFNYGIFVASFGALAVIVLSALSHLWSKGIDSDSNIPLPSIGIALVPIMMCGLVIYAVGLGMLLVA